MRIGVIPENLFERVGIALNVAPTPLGESYFTFILARVILVSTKLGIFDALADGPRTAEEIATRVGTDAKATGKLLRALVGARYLGCKQSRYELKPVARKWLIADAHGSVRDKILFSFLEWKWVEYAEEYVRSGKPLDLHSELTDDEWRLYQRGMRSAGIEPIVAELVRRIRLPRGASTMLDIGGSHGYYSVSFCRKHEGLRATILDLPNAVAHAKPLLEAEGMGDRVSHMPGDALSSELGENVYDFIFVGGLVHHFTDEQNRALAVRCARALKPGGVLTLFDALRGDSDDAVGQIAGIMDLTYGMTSQSGCWSPEEMISWQRAAGLVPRSTMRLMLMRDLGAQSAVKPLNP